MVRIPPQHNQKHGRDVHFEEVHDTEDVHHQVDVWQDDKAVDDRNDAQARGCEDHDKEGLFEISQTQPQVQL